MKYPLGCRPFDIIVEDGDELPKPPGRNFKKVDFFRDRPKMSVETDLKNRKDRSLSGNSGKQDEA